MNLVLNNTYWKAPPSANSIEAVIVLNSLSDVSSVILLVSPCGYSDADAPTVSLTFLPSVAFLLTHVITYVIMLPQ